VLFLDVVDDRDEPTDVDLYLDVVDDKDDLNDFVTYLDVIGDREELLMLICTYLVLLMTEMS
jgi:hypothetical protein